MFEHRIANRDVTGSVSPTHRSTTSAQQSDADWRKDIDVYGERYRDNPKDAEAALRYGQALRATGQRAQASPCWNRRRSPIRATVRCSPPTAARWSTTATTSRASTTLSRAHTPDNPDWHILSMQGTALDRLGRHEEARRYYNNALKIKPDEPSVLSNLGMSYVLSKQLAKAEEALAPRA